MKDPAAAAGADLVADGMAAEEATDAWVVLMASRADGVLLVAEVRYAVRVRGHSSDATAAASREGLEHAVDPVCTVLRGQLPDQSALLGVLRWVRQLGLELVEVRRLPQQGKG